jgi:hypothetical protein
MISHESSVLSGDTFRAIHETRVIIIQSADQMTAAGKRQLFYC